MHFFLTPSHIAAATALGLEATVAESIHVSPGLLHPGLNQHLTIRAGVLDVSANRLTSLPPSIGNLRKLKRPHIDDNDLFTLPQEITNLKNLRVLSVSNNKLESLPEHLGRLKKLRRLSAEDNELRGLTYHLLDIPKLESVAISGNWRLSIELRLAAKERGLQGVQKWLRQHPQGDNAA